MDTPDERSVAAGAAAPPPDRDRLIAAIYEATTDANAYGKFVAELGRYLEYTALNDWQIEDLRDIDVGAVEADRGLHLHLDNMNRMLARNPARPQAGSWRERIADRKGFAILMDRTGAILEASPVVSRRFNGALPTPSDLAANLDADDGRNLVSCIADFVKHGYPTDLRIFRGDGFHMTARTVQGNTAAELFLVIETLRTTWSESLEAALKSSFGLTPAELNVVKALSRGVSPKELSESTGRSVGTIRNQTKSILAKTRAGTVANLNRIVALLGEYLSTLPGDTHVRHLAERELDILTLPDGRTLEVRLQGPADGRPVLFIHGQLFGTELPDRAIAELHRHGIRLIAPSRPNFGASDPPPGPPESEPLRLIDDLIFVLDYYGIDRAPVLTNIAGAVYGYHFAAHRSDRVTGLVLAGAILPIVTVRQMAAQPPTQRLLCFLGRFAPEFLPPLYRSGLAQIHAEGEAQFLATLYREGTHDHAVTTDAGLMDLLKRSVHFGTDQGYFGVFTDTLHLVWDWSRLAGKVCSAGIPVVHVQGAHDPATMLSDVRAFVSRFDCVSLVELEDAGQLVLFSKPETVLAEVARILDRDARD